MNDKNFFVSKSHNDNVRIAGEILQEKIGLNRNRAHVIGLQGELGAGKTTWTSGLVDFLGGNSADVSSPTYVLMNEYLLGDNLYNFKKLYHLDLYRLKSADELKVLKLDEYLSDPYALAVVEWFDKFKRGGVKPNTILHFETINDFTKTIELIS